MLERPTFKKCRREAGIYRLGAEIAYKREVTVEQGWELFNLANFPIHYFCQFDPEFGRSDPLE